MVSVVSLPICKHLHLDLLKGNCQFSDQTTKLIISPAKSLQQFSTTLGISLMNTTNSIGSSTEP